MQKNVKAKVIIRGLRAVADFEYEFQMAGMNSKLGPEIETIFLMASENLQLTSARFVKKLLCMMVRLIILFQTTFFKCLKLKERENNV